jgi:aspartyl/asparaginyl-tRNA synthetase
MIPNWPQDFQPGDGKRADCYRHGGREPGCEAGGLEIQLESLEVEAGADSPLPFDLVSDSLPGFDYRMDWRFLDLRRPENLLIFQVPPRRDGHARVLDPATAFIEIHTPKLMGSPSESGAELFELPYFETQSLPGAVAAVLQADGDGSRFRARVRIGPVFRADPSFTSRHMTEFTRH